MCIAHVLSCLGKKYNFKIHAVHIKYSNRDESDKEADLIKEFCFQLDIIYHQIDITHIKRGEINRSFYETETRRIRFDFYLNIKKHYGIELFALGHHRGDIAENVLTNLIKGRTLLDLPVMQEFETQNIEDLNIKFQVEFKNLFATPGLKMSYDIQSSMDVWGFQNSKKFYFMKLNFDTLANRRKVGYTLKRHLKIYEWV